MYFEVLMPNIADKNLNGEIAFPSLFIDRATAIKWVAGLEVEQVKYTFFINAPRLKRVDVDLRKTERPVCELDTAKKGKLMRFAFRNQRLALKFIKGLRIRSWTKEYVH